MFSYIKRYFLLVVLGDIFYYYENNSYKNLLRNEVHD